MNTVKQNTDLGNILEDSKFDELSVFLQSHCQKKKIVHTAKSNNPMHVLIFQCGQETQSLHTIFIYIFTSLSNDMRFGKTLAQWFFKQSYEILQGVLPTFDNIKTEADLVNVSAICCFSTEHNSHTKQSLSVFLLLLI